VRGLVWLAKRAVPGREVRVDTAPRYLGDEFLNAPAIAVTQARNEVLRMGEMTSVMLSACRDALLSGDRTHVATVLETEETVDILWRTTENFLDRIDLGKLSLRDAKRLHVLQHVTGDIERVGDHAVNIAERAEAALDQKVTFSNEARRDLSDMFDKALRLYRLSLQALEGEDHPSAEEAFELEREVDRLEIRYKEGHIERVERGICNPSAGILYIEVLRNLERIGDHAVNIAGDVLLV
jgi:phosphate:Na+ symporter